MVGDRGRGRGVVVAGDSIAGEIARTPVLAGCRCVAEDGSSFGQVAQQLRALPATDAAKATTLVVVCSGANDGMDVVDEVSKHCANVLVTCSQRCPGADLVFIRPGWSTVGGSELASLDAARWLESEGETVRDVDGVAPSYGLVSTGRRRAAKRQRVGKRLHYTVGNGGAPDGSAFLNAQIKGIMASLQ